MMKQFRFGWTILSLAVLGLVLCLGVQADDRDRLSVGIQPDGRIVVPTNQILKPAGKQVTFPGRPVDLALIEDGRTLVVKNMRGLVFVDLATASIRQTLASSTGFSVVGLAMQGERVYVSDARDHVRIAERRPDGGYQWLQSLELAKPQVGGAAHPAGLTLDARGYLWVTSTRGNSVQRFNPGTGQVEETVPVGVAPYMLCFLGPDRCYVSNWGGDPPGKDDPQALSSGTPVRVDPRTSIGNQGTVSVLTLANGHWRQRNTIPVGLHPSGLAWSRSGRFLYVANASSDTVSVVDTKTDTVVETISCRPARRLPFGSGVNALALSPDGATLYAANGTNNCVAVVRLGTKATESATPGQSPASSLAGLIPTGWYPGAIVVAPDGKKLFVANVKGHGALSRQRPSDKEPRPAEKGRNSHDHLGSVSVIDVPDAEQLARSTAEVNANNRLAYSLAGLDKPRPDARPVPVPERHGEPSLFQHVIYIIKEN
ncbi:MAG: SMP-30/gluconolactonase/LRE family protein, partial [Gemmataceae bacterium]|nr:SMP-30/gluconolactonase/LRE family protein [Gemmataceae bacterium]